MNGRLPKKTYKKVVCSLYMEFSEFSLFDLVSGVFSPGWWKLSWTHGGWTPTKVTENGRPELARHLSCEWQHRSGQRAWAPSHNQRDWSSFRCWTSYRTELLGQSQWIFPFIYFFFGLFCQKIWCSPTKVHPSGSKFRKAVFQHSWDQA